MKNIYVGLLAAVACTYSMQAAANSLNSNNLNLVFKGDDFSLTAPFASHTAIPIGLKPISSFNSDNAVKLAAVCSVGGGGCSGLKFGEGNNSMKLNKNFLCEDEGYVRSCGTGYIPDTTQKCPHDNSYFKCKPCSNTCDSGYSLTACNSSTQVQTASYKNTCTNTCYQCRNKTCEEGGYAASVNSCQNGTAISFAGKTCYRNVSAKTCENGGYKSSVPANNKCTAVTYCSKTCQSNCYQPSCEESGFLSSCPTNHTCTTKTSYGRTCYVDGGQPTCEAGGYKSGVPTNQVCSSVSYYGRTCYQNCYQPQCAAGGYLDAVPSGKSCTSVTYYGRNCYKDCSDDPGAACKAAGYTQTGCDKFMTVEKCPSDSNYVKCTHTCGSRIFADNPTYNIDGQGSYTNPVNVITKNATSISGTTVYSNINFPQYAECKALPKPVITKTARETSPGYTASSIAGNRIENIDFVVNFTPYTKPKACDYIEVLRSWNGGLFCYPRRNNVYSSYAIQDSSSNYCYEYGTCVDDCFDSSSENYNDYMCEEYRQIIDETGTYQLCQWLNDNFNNSCANSSSSTSSAVKLEPSNRTTSTYSCDGRNSTKYSATMYLKNVNITVNGNPKIGVVIGGGAHYESTVILEGTNKITGGSAHAVWVRGHNTCSYGKVKGILQVSSGATLTLGKPACIYTGWNGVLNKYGTISGTVTTNCSTYPLKW